VKKSEKNLTQLLLIRKSILESAATDIKGLYHGFRPEIIHLPEKYSAGRQNTGVVAVA